MDFFIGLDIGTSKISAVALDARGELTAMASRPNEADLSRTPPGRHEQSPARILGTAVDVLRALAERLESRASSVAAIGLTGQMHGALLADERLEPITPLATWRDHRADEPAGAGRTVLQEFIDRAGADALAATGTVPAAGYLGPTVYWYLRNQGLPSNARWALLIHDWVAARLAGVAEPVTDPTDAASTGLYDLHRAEWSAAVTKAVEINPGLLATLRKAGSPIGSLDADVASETGLPESASVHTALGDNQASVLAALRRPSREVIVNIGTGGQISAVTREFLTGEGLEARPFPGGKFLLVGASLCGGAAFAYLAEHYARVLGELGGRRLSADHIMSELTRLAERAPAGAAGLTVEPFFLGKRSQPGRRGVVQGMSIANNTPAHWARAFMEGLVEELADGYRAMRRAGLDERTRLVGSGNGIRRNTVMRQAAMTAFGLPLAIPAWREEAACGAALAAMVGAGAIASFDAVRKVVRYESEPAGE